MNRTIASEAHTLQEAVNTGDQCAISESLYNLMWMASLKDAPYNSSERLVNVDKLLNNLKIHSQVTTVAGGPLNMCEFFGVYNDITEDTSADVYETILRNLDCGWCSYYRTLARKMITTTTSLSVAMIALEILNLTDNNALINYLRDRLQGKIAAINSVQRYRDRLFNLPTSTAIIEQSHTIPRVIGVGNVVRVGPDSYSVVKQVFLGKNCPSHLITRCNLNIKPEVRYVWGVRGRSPKDVVGVWLLEDVDFECCDDNVYANMDDVENDPRSVIHYYSNVRNSLIKSRINSIANPLYNGIPPKESYIELEITYQITLDALNTLCANGFFVQDFVQTSRGYERRKERSSRWLSVESNDDSMSMFIDALIDILLPHPVRDDEDKRNASQAADDLLKDILSEFGSELQTPLTPEKSVEIPVEVDIKRPPTPQVASPVQDPAKIHITPPMSMIDQLRKQDENLLNECPHENCYSDDSDWDTDEENVTHVSIDSDNSSNEGSAEDVDNNTNDGSNEDPDNNDTDSEIDDGSTDFFDGTPDIEEEFILYTPPQLNIPPPPPLPVNNNIPPPPPLPDWLN